MKVMKRIALFILVSITAIGLTGCNSDDGNEKRVIRVAHLQNTEHPQHKAMLEFEKYVEENTNGEIDVQIFPSGLLGPANQTVELCQTGAIDLVITGLGVLEAFEKTYSVLNLPYLMDSKEHYKAVMDDKNIMGPIYESTRDSGFIGLTWFDAGIRNIYTVKKPINTPEDLAGLKIRVQTSPTNVKMMEALGASPTPMSFAEVYTGLQQGVIDGAENNELALINNKHGEVAKYYSYNMHAMLPDILIVNADLMDKLKPEYAKVIRDAVLVANKYEVAAWAKAEKIAKKEAEKMGVKFSYPEIAPFQARMKDLHAEFTQTETAKEIYDKVRAKAEEISLNK